MEGCYEQSDKLKSCVKAEDFTTGLVTRTSQDRYCAMYEVLRVILCVVRDNAAGTHPTSEFVNCLLHIPSCIYEGESNEHLKYLLFFIMDDTVWWSMTHIQTCGYFIHCYATIFLHDYFNCCNDLWCHYSVCLTRSRRVCYRTNAVPELPSPLVHLL